MSLSNQTYLLTLYVTYQQESAIRNLFTSNGWLFRKKGDGSEAKVFVNRSNEKSTDDAILEPGYEMAYESDNEPPAGNDDFDNDHENDEIDETAHVPDTENIFISTDQIKVETVTTGDNDLIADFGDDTDEYQSEDESYKPGAKRKRSTQKKSNKKLKKGKNENKSTGKDQSSKSVSHKGSRTKKSTDKTPAQEKQDVKIEESAPASEISNLDLGVGADPDRISLEIELQETDDIDHFETVHKSLSPDEPFNPPSDVQETDGFSPSLGCYYCHDCGYTFQLQRWYKIHKWNGKCVYKCQVCSEVFTFRNVSSYRTHMKTHKFQAMDTSFHVHICPSCGDVFKTSSGLRKHAVTKHERDKLKFKCTDCDKVFFDNTHLMAHKRSNHGAQGLRCSVCLKEFSRKPDLNRHSRIHSTNDKKFKCPICGIGFSRKDMNDDHRRSAHGPQYQFVCDIQECGAKFKWRGSLSKHKSRKHPAWFTWSRS